MRYLVVISTLFFMACGGDVKQTIPQQETVAIQPAVLEIGDTVTLDIEKDSFRVALSRRKKLKPLKIGVGTAAATIAVSRPISAATSGAVVLDLEKKALLRLPQKQSGQIVRTVASTVKRGITAKFTYVVVAGGLLYPLIKDDDKNKMKERYKAARAGKQ